MKREDIKTLDDMANYFFQVAQEINKPLHIIKLDKGKYKW